ncbi:hypothetical protein F5887DRAFT_1075333 [Amanita rubescens]|nr:hypothetical protein F5887DRAFT_1075333 [Amanita rubescens]
MPNRQSQIPITYHKTTVMATTASTIESSSSKDETHVKILRERYECPHFRILVIGRANAGKTTILEKVCGVAKGTEPIIYDKDGELLQKSVIHLMPSIERGLHDIEHQITYPGSNFIFHDSRGFESGSNEELNIVQEFIEKRSAEIELKYQLHAIWYCIPMDSPRPILPAELEFFCKGTGKGKSPLLILLSINQIQKIYNGLTTFTVPLVVVFTKFDGQVINESANLSDTEDEDKWEKARQMAESIFQTVYLPKVLDTKYPPKAFVRLEDMDLEENNCPELTQHTAEAIDDISIQQLFISTQMNNLDLCVRSAIRHILLNKLKWNDVVLGVFSKFPHFWVKHILPNMLISAKLNWE